MSFSERLFLALIGVLMGIGVLMVYSASVTSRPTNFEQVYLTRHLGAAAIGLAAAVVCGLTPAAAWKRWAPVALWIILCLLLLVLLPGIGVHAKGASRWLRMGGVSLQPSELAKLVLPLMTCLAIVRCRDERTDGWAELGRTLWPTFLVVPLVLVEPDLGTAAFLALGTLLAVYLGGWPIRRFGWALCLLIPASAGLWLLKPYQMRRITGFVSTWTDLDAAPYQIRQSLVSLGAGGWWGTGVGKGWQKLSFLPEANTDFVFAVIGEELGLSGTLGLIVVWCGIYLSGMRMLSGRDPRSFEFIAGTTLLTQLVVQALFNVAVVTAMVPPKGISHPLISAGGSNLVASLMGFGILWSLSRIPAESVAEALPVINDTAHPVAPGGLCQTT